MASKRFTRHTWGGNRGGGRPASGVERVQVSYRLEPAIAAAIRAEAARRSVPASDVVAQLVRDWLPGDGHAGGGEAGA